MPKRLTDYPVRGWLRWIARLPIWLYRVRLGWLLGDRFLMLTHIGRKSGLPRQTVLEVVRHDRASDECIVASGWGETADWFRNVQRTPEVVVHVGGRKFAATAIRLSPEEAERELRDYARRHPLAFRELTGLILGGHLSHTEEDYYRLAHAVPLVALRPRDAA